jgi:hypothetical protein
MTIIAAVMRPYKLISMNFMAIFNEVMITVIMGYSGVFLQKDMNNDKAVELGWIWIALACFTIVFKWVAWIGIQIYDFKMRKKKINADDVNKVKATPEFDKDKADRQFHKDSAQDPHGFNDPGTQRDSKNVNFVERSNYIAESHYTMMSPEKKRFGDDVLAIHNYYADGLAEEEKIGDYDDFTSGKSKKVRKARKVSNLDDYDVPFGYSPSQFTAASPNKVLSADVSDEIQSVDSHAFSISAIRIGQVDYSDDIRDSAPRRFNTDSDYMSEVPETATHTKTKKSCFASDKNILMVKDL